MKITALIGQRIKPLNQAGFDHMVVAVIFIVGVALVGSYALVATHAATSQWKGSLEAFSSSSGYCLTAKGSTTGSKVVLSPCTKTTNNNQVWSIVNTKVATVLGVAGVQEFYLQSAAGNNECLNNPYGSKTSGSAMQLYPCKSTDPASTWTWGAKLTAKGYSAHQLVNLASVSGMKALCLDDAYGSTKDGTKVQGYACKLAQRTNQNWYEASTPAGSGSTGNGSGSSGSGGSSTPPPPTAGQTATQSCAPSWQTITLNGVQWVRTSNNWGGANVCLNAWDGKTVSYLVQSQSAAPKGGVMAYPDLSQGCGNGGGYCTTGWTSKQISALTHPQVTWTTSQAGVAAGSKYDTGADLWFSTTPNFKTNGAEIFIALNNQGEPPSTQKLVSIGGTNYYYYVVPQHGWNEIIFARQQQVSSVTNLNLLPFMQYAVSQNLMPSSYYFVNASFGNEIWQGGTGLQTTGLSFSE